RDLPHRRHSGRDSAKSHDHRQRQNSRYRLLQHPRGRMARGQSEPRTENPVRPAILCSILFFAACFVLSAAAPPKYNRLIHEKSPYLLQHAANPVDWYPWGNEAFEKARREDKPIYLSIGYSTCHWCHVMER